MTKDKILAIIFTILIILASHPILAQIPEGIPNNPNALNIESSEKILLYLVLPVVILAILTYWYYKRSKRRKN